MHPLRARTLPLSMSEPASLFTFVHFPASLTAVCVLIAPVVACANPRLMDYHFWETTAWSVGSTDVGCLFCCGDRVTFLLEDVYKTLKAEMIKV